MRDAQQADYVAVLYRYPTALDAYELGFAPGVREDYSYQIDAYPNVDLPVVVLDNDFTDPDIERYVDAFEQDDPSVAIVGDAYSSWAAEQLNELTEQLRDAYPQKRYVAVPKCRDAFDVLDDEVVLGYPIGYSDLQADDIADVDAWRGRPVHVLGGSPPTQYEAIMDLTQLTLSGEPPADIVGMDWNGFQKGAYLGEYWSDEGWQPADHLSIRETARESLRQIKYFWEERGIWPETEPRELYGAAVEEPDEQLFMDQGGDPIPDREALESAYVEEYEEYGTLAFASALSKKRLKYREGLTPVDAR